MHALYPFLSLLLIIVTSCTHLPTNDSWPFQSIRWPAPLKNILTVTVNKDGKSSQYQWIVEAMPKQFTFIVMGASGRRLGTLLVKNDELKASTEWPLRKKDLQEMAVAAQQILLVPAAQKNFLVVRTEKQARKLFFGSQLIAEIAYTPEPKTFTQAVYQAPSGFRVTVQSNQQIQ